jgi:hypothetical protein
LGNTQVESTSKAPVVSDAGNVKSERVPEDAAAAIALAVDQFTWRVSDGIDTSAVATVKFLVSNVQDHKGKPK